MNEIAAYGGFPSRYPHWRFGMEYEQLAKSYEYGLSKIYEMVINNNPSYAYLLEGNSLVDQKLVMAHVYGHVDFFKNNFCFRSTDLDQRHDRSGAQIERYDPTAVDRQDGQPRRARAAPHRAPRHRQGRELHRPLPVAREPDRPAWRRSSARTRRSDADDEDEDAAIEVAAARAPRTTWSRSSTREEYLEAQRRRSRRSAKREKRVPGAPRARRAEVPARPRAARALGARRARDHPRGGLLLRPADADQDHERGLGLATGTRRS